MIICGSKLRVFPATATDVWPVKHGGIVFASTLQHALKHRRFLFKVSDFNMPKLGKKFRTLHKFGQRRKKKTNKGKIGDCGDGDREQTNSAASSSASDPADTTAASSTSVSVAVSSSSSTTPGASTSTSTETSSLQETLTQKPCSFKRKMHMFASRVTPSDSEDEYDVDTSECAKKKAKKKADAVGVNETDPERQNLSVIFDINCLQSLEC